MNGDGETLPEPPCEASGLRPNCAFFSASTISTGMFRGAYGWPGTYGCPTNFLGSVGGSFSELMLNATSGALQFENFGDARITHTGLQQAGASEMRMAGNEDGYLGGQESDDADGSDFSDGDVLEPAEKGCTYSEEAALNDGEGRDLEPTEKSSLPSGNNVNGDGWGISNEETEEEVEINVDRKAIGAEVDIDEDTLSDESDSDESDGEDEITIEVDLSQEIYNPPTQEAGPYKKRKHAPKNDNRPNYRKPRSMGAIERALRSASTKKDGEYLFEPIIGMVFDSRQEAKEYYNMYSWEVGFGVKYDGSRPGSKSATREKIDGEEQYKSMQEIVCQKAGFDPRTTTGSKRCGCPAKIRLLRTEDHGWYITIHEAKHNHPFAKTAGEKREWNSHRDIEPFVKDMIKYLRQSNVCLTKGKEQVVEIAHKTMLIKVMQALGAKEVPVFKIIDCAEQGVKVSIKLDVSAAKYSVGHKITSTVVEGDPSPSKLVAEKSAVLKAMKNLSDQHLIKVLDYSSKVINSNEGHRVFGDLNAALYSVEKMIGQWEGNIEQCKQMAVKLEGKGSEQAGDADVYQSLSDFATMLLERFNEKLTTARSTYNSKMT